MEKLDIAYEYGLNLIETTSDRGGYPQELKHAIIGFNSFEEAEELAERFGLEVQEFVRRDGWQLWHRTGNKAYDPYDYLSIMREEGECILGGDVEHVADLMKRDVAERTSPNDIISLIHEYEDVLTEVAAAESDEFVFVKDGVFEGIYPCITMDYAYDTKQYAIGLV